MGYYIPNSISLESNGATRTNVTNNLSDVPDDKALICQIDNGSFMANALMYSQKELDYFIDPRDKRKKSWYLMDKQKAHDLSGYKKIVTG